MTRHRLYRDDALVYDYSDTTVPPPGPVDPVPPQPVGNPIMVPVPAGNWTAMIERPAGAGSFRMHSGEVAAFEVPIPGGDVTLRFGQMAVSPPNCVMEFCLSVTPGDIRPSDSTYQKISFNNNFPYTVRGWTAGKLYLNVRWTYPSFQYDPGGHSATWNY